MHEPLLTWLASLRVRLIVTYVLVTVISFSFLFILLMRPGGPIEKFIMEREEDLLIASATVLASTIPSPVEADEATVDVNMKWTQRRCRNVLMEKLPNTRIRVLDDLGRPLVDSNYYGTWEQWRLVRHQQTNLRERTEVRSALHGFYLAQMRYDTERTGNPYTMCVALPVMRTDPDTKNLRLGFVMYLDRTVEPVRKNLQDIRHLMLLGTLASLLVTILVSILLSSNLSAGLRAAMRIAHDFAAGRMDARMRESGRDEVGQLGKAFNGMADALQHHEQLRRSLLADVSHELRTPLTAITGCAESLSDGALRDDPAAAEHFLGIIQRESERLQRLVTDILELSKLQAGTVDIPRIPLRLSTVIEDAVEIARLHARQEGVTVVCECADCATEVLGNEDRLAQALRNLLDNALHHTPEGKTITVAVDCTPEMATIHIRDEGEGIPPKELPWVFDRFYRAGKGKKRAGAGLGLAIVREIMQAHEGTITVESVVGVGTTFSLHFPRKVQADATLVLN